MVHNQHNFLKNPRDCLVGYPMHAHCDIYNKWGPLYDRYRTNPTKDNYDFWLHNELLPHQLLYKRELGFCPNLLPNYGVYSNTWYQYTPMVVFPSISLGFKMVTGNLRP
jgi:hypothetical protein